MSRNNAVYIMTNYANTTFYIGVTNNLLRRIWEHKTKAIEGFTSRYNIKKLVYFELTDNIEDALNREKQLKNWRRQWKIDLIKKDNPEFKDLSYDIGYTDPESSSG
jgi:putative endonuclease